jgi:hypothetical protein
MHHNRLLRTRLGKPTSRSMMARKGFSASIATTVDGYLQAQCILNMNFVKFAFIGKHHIVKACESRDMACRLDRTETPCNKVLPLTRRFPVHEHIKVDSSLCISSDLMNGGRLDGETTRWEHKRLPGLSHPPCMQGALHQSPAAEGPLLRAMAMHGVLGAN